MNGYFKNRLGLNFKYEKYNTPNKISPYQEMLYNKSYSIFLENVSLKNVINEYISSNSTFSSSSEADDTTKKSFIRKIIDRILEIWDKFLDWLYRVQIKIVTSRLFGKVNSILEKLKKNFKIYPVNIKIKKYIKTDFIDSSVINDRMDKYAKAFEKDCLLLKESFKKLTEVSEKMREELDNSNEFFQKTVLKLDLDNIPSAFQLSKSVSLGILPTEFIKESEEEKYTTIKINNKKEDKAIRTMLHRKIKRIEIVLEVTKQQFTEVAKLANDTKHSLKELVKDLDRKKIDNKLTIDTISKRYRSLNELVTHLTRNTSKVIQDNNKRLTEELNILESNLSEFLK